MKKLIASAGLVTLGAAGAHAAYAPGLTAMETAKPWSIAATVRGFYDDNYNNAPSHPSPGLTGAKSSGGFEISPTFKLNFPMEQTYLGAGLLYSMKYYFDRPKNNIDHLIELTLKADHRLTERYKVSFDDSFVYSVEPEIAGETVTSFVRTDSDYLRNRAAFDFKAQLTELLGAE